MIDTILEIIEENNRMKRELEIAEHTEQHLKSAENALIEKDKRIALLEECLEDSCKDTIDARKSVCEKRKTICELEKKVQSWEDSYHKMIERNGVLRKALDKRDAEIAKQANKIADLRNKLSIARTQRDQYAQQVQNCFGPLEILHLQMEISNLLGEVQKYKAALKDLEGSLWARTDHDKELAETIHKLLCQNPPQ